MAAWLTAASVAVGLADLLLLMVCWRRRSVLGGFCGAAGIALVVLAVASGSADRPAGAPIVIALVTLVMGTVLLVLGEAVWRLLEDAPDEDA